MSEALTISKNFSALKDENNSLENVWWNACETFIEEKKSFQSARYETGKWKMLRLSSPSRKPKEKSTLVKHFFIFFGGSRILMVGGRRFVGFWRGVFLRRFGIAEAKSSTRTLGTMPRSRKRLGERHKIYEWKRQKFSVGPWISIPAQSQAHAERKPFSRKTIMKMLKIAKRNNKKSEEENAFFFNATT